MSCHVQVIWRCDVCNSTEIIGRRCNEFYQCRMRGLCGQEQPRMETRPAPEESFVKAFERSPRRVPETGTAPKMLRDERCPHGVSKLNHCNTCD